MAQSHQTVRVDGRSLRLSSLDKVLYPATGTTKGQVIGYYSAIAPVMIAHCRDRAATRKRWPNGVGEDGEAESFFQKDIGEGAPSWLATTRIEHSDHANTYPLVNDEATLVWLAQLAALEIHVPQWKVGPGGEQRPPDRMVLDLDPGPGVDLRQCAQVAFMVRDLLADMGLESVPVTSGSKGIHVYAALDGRQSSKQVSAVARELARSLEADHPKDITSTMKRSVREGKVFIDWSQNNPNKTTVAPYSLRGRAHPTVAAPRTWRELASPTLRHLEFDEVLDRVKRRGDPMAELSSGTPTKDRLGTYRSKRDPDATPEPVPEEGKDEQRRAGRPVFVIQRHEARRLHHDFRLEHDGVLVSWALPKGVPTDPQRNHLAVQTEDHPMSYRTFEGTIPKGQYGAGTVEIWDEGTFELEKWRDDEVIATLTGRRGGGLGGKRRFALFRTGEDPSQWMIHLMEDKPRPRAKARAAAASAPKSARKAPASPMLATLASEAQLLRLDASEWAFEMKWDGVRAIVEVGQGGTAVFSRSGADMTAQFPEFADLAEHLDVDSAVLDGEIVAFAANGAPSFERLQSRLGLTGARDVQAAMRKVKASLILFDVLKLNGEDCKRLPYSARRELLEEIAPDWSPVAVPPVIEGTVEEALATSKEHHLEGVVAKRRTSRYKAGTRSEDWLKHPFADNAEVVVIGWRHSDADPKGFRSLLLAAPMDGVLRYAGRVSSGFGAKERREIRAQLSKRERDTPAVDVPASDMRDATWVAATRVGEVSFRERTSEGRFRHPVWRGFRRDKSPKDLLA